MPIQNNTKKSFKSGFVSIVGRPNVGKSTLLNKILGEKVVVTSPVAQTTRNVLRGIKTTEDYQMVFVDTPGIHSPKDPMGRLLNKKALSSLHGADVILILAPVDEYIGPNDHLIINYLRKESTPVIMCVTKSDLAKYDDLENKINAWKEFNCFTDVIPISTVKDYNIGLLVNEISNYLPIGPHYYADDCISDQSEDFYVREIIREKILKSAKEEIPHHIAVLCESIVHKSNIIVIHSHIIVGRDSQKGIIIGKKGQNIQQIGRFARLDLEKYFKKKVYLDLSVKVVQK